MGRTEVLPLSCAHVRTCLGRAAREQGSDKRSQIRRESAEVSSKREGGQLGLESDGLGGELTGGARTATARAEQIEHQLQIRDKRFERCVTYDVIVYPVLLVSLALAGHGHQPVHG